ncbi:unnamed protein product [Linum tenue]|uniref:Glycosyltransferase n=1 Tax=Linum tenue TaxID=586396 RepID=A0AAV0RIL5_9ROSI|nr:unnamed protein product [Linum tenue]
MASRQQLHVYFFPFMAHGHMIPAVDMAKLFASRGVTATIVTTPLNAPLFSKTIKTHPEIRIRTLDFPAAEVGLPAGCENVDFITSRNLGREAMSKFFLATTLLREPLEKLLDHDRPDCLVADMFFPWSTDSAARFGVPRLLFHGTGFFALSAMAAVAAHQPYNRVASDTDPFVLPGLPHEIRLTKRQGGESDFMSEFFRRVREANSGGYGTLVNSFYELEPAYVDHYGTVLGRKAWHVGPVSLANADVDDKASRGGGGGGRQAVVDQDHQIWKWLDAKEQNAVVYICFGSVANFGAEQMREIAIGIEASGRDFVWVVRGGELPEGFEARTEGRGMVIRGWAPQVLILEHEAVGAFVTHCGWNSTLEGIAAGLPMVTWPVSAEQFYNEKLVTEVVGIGVGVGAEQAAVYRATVESGKVERAVRRIMSTGDEEESGGGERWRKEGLRTLIWGI